ncbi:hypothetical protein niasHS_009014 [Heterodera schachtii]|uniref:Uncharacterized protein n=2 Tax=Heterodera TaxID=34509 RepID=A0ABD2JSC1_9BILA
MRMKKAPIRLPGGTFFIKKKHQIKKKQFKRTSAKKTRIYVQDVEIKMRELTLKSVNSEVMPEVQELDADEQMHSSSACFPFGMGSSKGQHTDFGSAFASELLKNNKQELMKKIEEIESRILFFLARESKVEAISLLNEEIERGIKALDKMFP